MMKKVIETIFVLNELKYALLCDEIDEGIRSKRLEQEA